MREIKFRAWDQRTKNMYSQENFGFYFGSQVCDFSWNIDIDGECMLNSEDGVLMQFTGLYDHDGNEIYEGDILNQGGGQTVIQWDRWRLFDDLQNGELNDYKVIGNVF